MLRLPDVERAMSGAADVRGDKTDENDSHQARGRTGVARRTEHDRYRADERNRGISWRGVHSAVRYLGRTDCAVLLTTACRRIGDDARSPARPGSFAFRHAPVPR